AEQMIYWTDVTTQGSMIRRMHMNGSNMEVLHRTSLSNPDGLAVDWVGGNLYWCDKGRDTIEVSKLNGAFRTVLVNSGLKEPRAVAVDVRYGYLYWSDWGDNPHIGRIGMDGTNRSVIVKDKITWPNGLTLDFINDRIYWADAREDYIEFASLDGSSRHTVLNQDIPHIFAMTLFEEYIYWTDWETKSINRAHKTLGTNKTTLISTLHRPMDIHIYHPYRQPAGDTFPQNNENPGLGRRSLSPRASLLSGSGGLAAVLLALAWVAVLVARGAVVPCLFPCGAGGIPAAAAAAAGVWVWGWLGAPPPSFHIPPSILEEHKHSPEHRC
uniref:Uncharacterized protein n=1 Tax=Oryzias latipes TaxID=8090 RepID=A0A3B3H7Q1_ORYLA